MNKRKIVLDSDSRLTIMIEEQASHYAYLNELDFNVHALKEHFDGEDTSLFEMLVDVEVKKVKKLIADLEYRIAIHNANRGSE